jgi:uncharacterized membrane protein
MVQAIKLYLVTLGAFFIIDMVWLGLVAKNFYREQLGFLMKTNINWAAAIAFYLLFVVGILFFVVYPSLAKGSWQYALLAGAFFGLITYATYDLSNLATLKDWPLVVTLVDLVWGSVLSGTLSVIGFLFAKKFF